jgi:hypothetical protein
VKVRVKPSSREVSGLHHRINTRSRVALLAKQASGRSQDALVGLLLVILSVAQDGDGITIVILCQ